MKNQLPKNAANTPEDNARIPVYQKAIPLTGKYCPSQKRLEELEKAYEKKMDIKKLL